MKLLREAIILVLLGISLMSVPLGMIALYAGLSGRGTDTSYAENVWMGLTLGGIGILPLATALVLIAVVPAKWKLVSGPDQLQPVDSLGDFPMPRTAG